MSEITNAHLHVIKTSMKSLIGQRNVIKALRDARRTKPTAGILSLQISSELIVKSTFQAISRCKFTPNIIPNDHVGHHKTDTK